MGIEAETPHSPSLDAAEFRHFEGLAKEWWDERGNLAISMPSIRRGSHSLLRKSGVGVINKTNPFAPWTAFLSSTLAAEAASCRNRSRGSAGV